MRRAATSHALCQYQNILRRHRHLRSNIKIGAPFAISVCLFAFTPDAALADFTQPSVACPGAVEFVEGDPTDVARRVAEVRILSGETATCQSQPRIFPDPANPFHNSAFQTQIVADGSNVTFVNNVTGFNGSTPIFETAFTGTGHKIINNGDLFVLLQGANAEVINTGGSMTGLIEGDDPVLSNSGAILGMTVEGARARITNDGDVSGGVSAPEAFSS